MYCLWLLVFVAQFSYAQDLVNSPQQSQTFIYKLKVEDARQAYQQRLDSIYESYLTHKVDSFGFGKAEPNISLAGTYLYLKAEENTLKAELREVSPINVELLHHTDDLVISVQDSLGEVSAEACVVVDGRFAKFDQDSKTFRRAKQRRNKLLEVTLNGHTSFYQLKNDGQGGFTLSRVFRRILYFRPVYYIWSPFRDIVNSIRYGELNGWLRVFQPNTEPYQGYVITQKPVYRPGDTVYYKAVVLDKGKLTRKDFTLELEGSFDPASRWRRSTKLLQENVSPYVKGKYSGSFILQDSLNLILDRQFSLQLRHRNRSISTILKFEDYELKGDKFSLNISREEHTQGTPPILNLKATDANDLPLQGASVKLYILPKLLTISESTTMLLVSDTLWRHQLPLLSTGSTELQLPDSLFGDEKMDYKLIARLQTAENNYLTEEKTLQYVGEQHLQLYEKNNNIIAELKKGDSLVQAKALISYKLKNMLIKDSVNLPYALAINPNWQEVSLYYPKMYKTLDINSLNAGVSLTSQRTNDSVFIYIDNSRRLSLSYQVYRGKGKDKKLVADATSAKDEISLGYRARKNDVYFVELQYTWAGKVKNFKEEIPLLKNWITLELDGPKLVKPGQQATYTVLATDYKGKPIPNVDLTTAAYNSKLPHSYDGRLPYLGKERWRPIYTFAPGFANQNPVQNYALDYDRFRTALGLDSLEFYHFLYPNNQIYTNEIETGDSLAQFAPYIVKKGNVQAVVSVYINGLPVYYSESNTIFPYSFPVRSDTTVEVKVRTVGREFILNHQFAKGKKTILSFTENTAKVSVNKVEYFLTDKEKHYLDRFMFKLEPTERGLHAYLQQGNSIQLLSTHESYYTQYSTITAGPFMPGYPIAKVFADTTLQPIEWPMEGGYTYSVKPGLVLGKEYKYTNQYGYGEQPNLLFGDFSLTPASIQYNYYQDVQGRKQQKISFSHPSSTKPDEGRIQLGYNNPEGSLAHTTRLQEVMLIGVSDTSYVQVYPGNNWFRYYNRLLHGVPPGRFKLIGFVEGDSLITVDNIQVQASATTYINLAKFSLVQADEKSIILRNLIQQQNKVSVIATPQEQQSHISKVYRMQSPDRSAGSHVVSGRVVSGVDGFGLPGVAIQIKGTKFGTTTNIDGDYTIYCQPTDVLVYSFYGYATENIGVGVRSVIDVALEEELELLEAVVVTAMGVSRAKNELTYASSTISRQLQGSAAGVRITNSSGKVIRTPRFRFDDSDDESGQIIIRGASSIAGDDKPLYIIDGVLQEGDLSISEDDIASISVLKGNEASALYGSRASNGVIIITTNGGYIQPESLEQTLAAQAINKGNGLRSNFKD